LFRVMTKSPANSLMALTTMLMFFRISLYLHVLTGDNQIYACYGSFVKDDITFDPKKVSPLRCELKVTFTMMRVKKSFRISQSVSFF
jgi:hypothetical protein